MVMLVSVRLTKERTSMKFKTFIEFVKWIKSLNNKPVNCQVWFKSLTFTTGVSFGKELVTPKRLLELGLKSMREEVHQVNKEYACVLDYELM